MQVITSDNVTNTEVVVASPPLRARAGFLALLCLLHLLNLSGGWIEIPDCLPVVGNLDEVAATVVLMGCLGRMGIRVVPRQG